MPHNPDKRANRKSAVLVRQLSGNPTYRELTGGEVLCTVVDPIAPESGDAVGRASAS